LIFPCLDQKKISTGVHFDERRFHLRMHRDFDKLPILRRPDLSVISSFWTFCRSSWTASPKDLESVLTIVGG